MISAKDVDATAQKMLAQYGEHTVRLMESRARNHLRRADLEGVEFWRCVADTVRRLAAWKAQSAHGPMSRACQG